MDGRRDALSRFRIDVAGRAGRGGAETLGDPGDQVASGVITPPSGVSVEHHCGEADAVLLASVGCPPHRRVQGSWAETGGQSEVPGFWKSKRRRVGRAWHVDEVVGALLSLSEDGALPPRRLRRRCEPPRCVCGSGLMHKGRRRRGRPTGHVPDRTRDKECLGHGKGMRRRSVRIPVKKEGVGPSQQPTSSAHWEEFHSVTSSARHGGWRSRIFLATDSEWSLEVRRPRRSNRQLVPSFFSLRQ